MVLLLTPRALAAYTVRAKVRLIYFDLAVVEWLLALAFFRDAPSDFDKDLDD